MRKVLHIALASVFATLCALGCATTPRFEPSHPIESAPSLPEGLLLCDEYHLPRDPSGAGRPVALRPYLVCVDDLADRFGADASTQFRTFQDELIQLYHSLKDETWTAAKGVEYETAIHAILRALWRDGIAPGIAQTADERALVIRDFPRSANALRADEWKVSRFASYDRDLEGLIAGVSAVSGGQAEFRAPVVSSQQGVQNAELCQRFEKLGLQTQYLEALWRDQGDFTRMGGENPNSARVREKYRTQLADGLARLAELRPVITAARRDGVFRVTSCGSPASGG